MALKINFTKSTLDDLTCPQGKSDILVYDTEIKGLAIRVTKAGGKTFLWCAKSKGETTGLSWVLSTNALQKFR